jgi:Family of unknown function (DUF5337)
MTGITTEAMMERSPRELAILAEGRVIALVVAVAMLGWMGVQWLGGQMGWPPKYILLADLSAAAAFLWSVVAAWRLMQRLKE